MEVKPESHATVRTGRRANVTVIPATRSLHIGIRNDVVAKRKTAGYTRISTDREAQLTSYEVKVDYYTNYIKSP